MVPTKRSAPDSGFNMFLQQPSELDNINFDEEEPDYLRQEP